MEGAKHRTQISLEKWQYQMLMERSRAKRMSLSAILREMVGENLSRAASSRRKDPLRGIVGMSSGDGASAGREHDDHLYGKRG
ncbi:MAG: hypothetical protein OHK0028_13750 [Deltaproteobacteria bacterium]